MPLTDCRVTVALFNARDRFGCVRRRDAPCVRIFRVVSSTRLVRDESREEPCVIPVKRSASRNPSPGLAWQPTSALLDLPPRFVGIVLGDLAGKLGGFLT